MRRKILVALVLAIALVCVAGIAMATETTEPTHTEHTGGTATCTKRAVCDTCGDSYGKTNRQNHTVVEVPRVEPTCTETGLTAGTKCSECDKVLSGMKTIRKTAHTPVAIDYVAPTCTETGLTAGTQCSECDKVLSGMRTIRMIAHDPVAIDYVAPTCTEAGHKGGTECSVCHTILKKWKTIDATGHAPVSVTGYAATCTEDGLTDGEECSVCHVVLSGLESIPATGHTYVAEIIAPTCTEDGYTQYTCSECGDTYTADETARLLHWYGEWTCNDDGTHSATCRRTDCSHTGKADCAELEVVLSGSSITLCPVCGEASDGTRLELVSGAGCESDDDLPRGELVVRKGTLADGTELMTVAFEYAGKLEQPTGIVTISLPAEALEGYSLMLINADGTQTALTAASADDILSFDLDFTTEDGEEAVPSVAIRLVPAA